VFHFLGFLNNLQGKVVSPASNPQPGVPGPRIYIPQEQAGPVIHPGTRFPFRRLLRLAGPRWRYSSPPPRGPNNIRIIKFRRMRWTPMPCTTNGRDDECLGSIARETLKVKLLGSFQLRWEKYIKMKGYGMCERN
jgi:hypothetical protein